jgi:hypothetical protein
MESEEVVMALQVADVPPLLIGILHILSHIPLFLSSS